MGKNNLKTLISKPILCYGGDGCRVNFFQQEDSGTLRSSCGKKYTINLPYGM